MRRGTVVVLAVGLAAALASLGCQPAAAPPVGPPPEQVDVWIFFGPDVEPVHKVVSIAGRPTVLQVTRQAAPVATEITSTGEEWVAGIAGRMADVSAGTMWSYELNNEAPTTAPNLTQVAPRDTIFWRLH